MEYINPNSELLPCPINLGWELVKTIEIENKDDDNKFVGGFSAISYLKDKDSSKSFLTPYSKNSN